MVLGDWQGDGAALGLLRTTLPECLLVDMFRGYLQLPGMLQLPAVLKYKGNSKNSPPKWIHVMYRRCSTSRLSIFFQCLWLMDRKPTLEETGSHLCNVARPVDVLCWSVTEKSRT